MVLKRISGRALLAAAVLAACLGGCNQMSKPVHEAFVAYDHADYRQATLLLKPEAEKKNEDYVLNNCRLGSVAVAWGQGGALDEAQNAFMNAYQVINSAKTNDAGRQAGVVLLWEGVKVWKGEPFEQAMAHYYLGMIFLIKHDYENARAAFTNSLFQVREYAKKDDVQHYQMADSTFALGYFGEGFCYLRLAQPEKAQASFKEALRCDPSLTQLINDVQKPGVNTLIFVDAGAGPQKAGKGWYNEESAFGPTPQEVGPIPPIEAFADQKPLNNPKQKYSTVDTLAMAQQRGWQDIDTVKKVKAVVGTGMMAAGTGMAAYGAANNDKGMFWGGLGALAAGALISASSQSDLRAWGMLPRTVYIIPATLPPGPHVIGVVAAGHQSAPLQTTVRPTGGPVPSDNVFYFRLR